MLHVRRRKHRTVSNKWVRIDRFVNCTTRVVLAACSLHVLRYCRLHCLARLCTLAKVQWSMLVFEIVTLNSRAELSVSSLPLSSVLPEGIDVLASSQISKRFYFFFSLGERGGGGGVLEGIGESIL